MAIHFFTLLKHFGWGEYLRRILFHCARGVWGQEASTPLSPKPPLLQRSRRTSMVQRWYFFRMCAAPNSGGTMFIFDYSAPRRQPFGWSPRGLVARVSLHSRRQESARPLRNTAAAYSVPTLRARREAPSLVSGFGVGFALFQPAGALSTGQYMRAVPKQRQRPQTANRLEGIISLYGVEFTAKVISVCGPNIIGNFP